MGEREKSDVVGDGRRRHWGGEKIKETKHGKWVLLWIVSTSLTAVNGTVGLDAVGVGFVEMFDGLVKMGLCGARSCVEGLRFGRFGHESGGVNVGVVHAAIHFSGGFMTAPVDGIVGEPFDAGCVAVRDCAGGGTGVFHFFSSGNVKMRMYGRFTCYFCPFFLGGAFPIENRPPRLLRLPFSVEDGGFAMNAVSADVKPCTGLSAAGSDLEIVFNAVCDVFRYCAIARTMANAWD